MTPREKLVAAGEAIFGSEWRGPMAELLGPYHPDGPRDHIDARRVRRWAAGTMEVDEWVVLVLPKVLTTEAEMREAEAAEMRRIAAVIEGDA